MDPKRTPKDDRCVHAEGDMVQVVRYDRAGGWYLEPPTGHPRKKLNLAGAADWAVKLEREGGVIHLGLPGGGAFDRQVASRKESAPVDLAARAKARAINEERRLLGELSRVAQEIIDMGPHGA